MPSEGTDTVSPSISRIKEGGPCTVIFFLRKAILFISSVPFLSFLGLFLLHISLITPSDLSLTILLCHILLFTLKKIFSKLATLNEGDGRPGHHPPAAGILQGKAHGLHALYTKQFLAANKPLTE